MRAVLISGITLMVVSMFAGCTARPEALRGGTGSSPTATKPPIVVRAVEAKPSAAAGDLLVPAALSVEVAAMVLAERDGAISQLGAQEGSRVTKGQIIAQLSGDNDLRAQLKQAELEVSRLD